MSFVMVSATVFLSYCSNTLQILLKNIQRCHGISEVLPYVNHPHNIGHGECKLLEKGVQFVKKLLKYHNPKFILKLGARYDLTNEFDLSTFDPEKFTFREHYDECAKVYGRGRR